MAAQLKPLNEQVIVITGASSGIGLATARAAAAKGAAVVLAARSRDALQKIASEINAKGGQALAVECDVSERGQVERVAGGAVAGFGRIDTWVNDAGLGMYGRLDETTEEDARRLFDINFWGVVNGSLAALPHLKKQGGALINVGSEVSDAVVPLIGMYAASKHAVKGFTDGLRIEIEEIDKAPVSVTLIQPTAVDTPFPQHARNYMPQEPQLPMEPIDPQKVAEAILDAAEHPTRVKKVGVMAVMNTAMWNYTPAIAEKVAAGFAEKQKRSDAPRNPDGALYEPSEIAGPVGTTHGTVGREKK